MQAFALLRSPLARFLAAGALLFALREGLRRDDLASTEPRPVAATGSSPAAPMTDDALLHREARARGLDADDAAIDAWLLQKMLFLDDTASSAEGPALVERARALGLDREDVVLERILVEKLLRQETEPLPSERPSESDLRRAYAADNESLRSPERRDLVQIFFSRDRRAERTERDAASARRRISTSDAAGDPGDPFPLGRRFERRSEADLARDLGEPLARAAFALEPGEWSAPLESAYGFHLVRVEATRPGERLPFEAVRERLRLELEEAIRARKRVALLAALRKRYEQAHARAGAQEKS